ncbi:hypothetical protein HYY70_04490 [Candidatus Woesearchaeota archaeon]|nr:hypothetical protein [Candidatus Woesearchaeota archaeon]
MANSGYDLSPSYVRETLYNPDGSLRKETQHLANFLVRGVSGALSLIVANEGEQLLHPTARNKKPIVSKFVNRFGIEFQLAATVDGRITFYSSASREKAAKELRQHGFKVPQYIDEIVLSGELPQSLYVTEHVKKLGDGRFPVFNVGEDRNAGTVVQEYVSRLRIPLEYALSRWDLRKFAEYSEIKTNLERAGIRIIDNATGEIFVPDFSNQPVYNVLLVLTALNEGLKKISTKEAVRALFGDVLWIDNAMHYSKAVAEASRDDLKAESAKELGKERRFVDASVMLLNHYLERMSGLTQWKS